MYIKNKYNQKLFTDTLYIPQLPDSATGMYDKWLMSNILDLNLKLKGWLWFFFKIWLNTVDKYKFH